ncbi:MAG: LCCL domain-containing protein [bacterium]
MYFELSSICKAAIHDGKLETKGGIFIYYFKIIYR